MRSDGERTLETFYKHVQPFATAFMALFGRDRMPHHSTLSRFLTALDQGTVEALRTLFLRDLLARPLGNEQQLSGLWDRACQHWIVFDIDGTREAARQRALPQTADRPAPQRRFTDLCAPGYMGRKRGEVVRTRTTVFQMHTHQWLGTFGGTGSYWCAVCAPSDKSEYRLHSYISLHRTSILEIYYQYQEKISRRNRSRCQFELQKCTLYYMLMHFAPDSITYQQSYTRQLVRPKEAQFHQLRTY